MNEQYEVTITKSAQKEIRNLPKSVSATIIPSIFALADDPRPHGCKKLTNSRNSYRVRVGDFRILYSIEDRIRIVEVSAVKHRREAYE